MADAILTLHDGRRLGYAEWGDPQAPPVVVFHGTPGCRCIGRGMEVPARLIVPDRPGYGLSDSNPGRRIRDYPADIEQLLDHLGIGRFHLFAISGGCPYLLASALAFKERMLGGAVLSGIGSLHGDDVTEGMEPIQANMVKMAKHHPWLLRQVIAAQVRMAPSDPETVVRHMLASAPAADRIFAESTPGVIDALVDMQREAVHRVEGPLEDALALVRDWELPLADVSAPVRFWHGGQDTKAPLRLTRQLVDAIPGAELTEVPGANHFGTLRFLPDAVRFLTSLPTPSDGGDVLGRPRQHLRQRHRWRRQGDRVGSVHIRPRPPRWCRA